MQTVYEKLQLAEKHLNRVLDAWHGPELDHLSIYGLYCLEAAVEAAALGTGIAVSKQHWRKSEVAAELHREHGLTDIEELMRDLNDARKAEAYGDVVAPSFDPQDVATAIESYVNEVRELLRSIDEADEEQE